MIRPFTLICAILFAVSGLYLYQAKHRSQMVDRQIVSTMKAVDEARNRAVLLHAEYALLNDPQRLQELAGQYLTQLRPTEPTQFTSMAELSRHLPPVGAPPVEPPPVEPDAPTASAPTATSDPTAPAPVGPASDTANAIASATPLPPPMPPPAPPRAVRVASTAPAIAAPGVASGGVASGGMAAQTVSLIRPVAPPQRAASSRPAAPHPTALHPAPAVGYVAQAPAAIRPVATARYEPPRARQSSSNEAPPTTTAEAIRRIARGGPIDPSVPVVASALGMARSMMVAPTAIAPASAATLDRGRVRQ